MKVTIEIDCTPDEARQFFGLPDVKPMQAALMAEIEQRMREGIASFSPDALIRQWFTALPQGAEQFQKAMEAILRGGWGGRSGG